MTLAQLACRLLAGTPYSTVAGAAQHDPVFLTRWCEMVAARRDDPTATSYLDNQFSPEVVRQIWLWSYEGVAQHRIAYRLGTTPNMINRVLHGQTHTGIEPPPRPDPGPQRVVKKKSAPLTPDQVREIRRLAAQGVAFLELCRLFDMAAAGMRELLAGRSYRHVTDEETAV